MAIFVSQTNIDKYMAVHRDDSERFRRLSILGRIGWWEADFSSRQYLCSEYVCKLLGLEGEYLSFEDFGKMIREDYRTRISREFLAIQNMEVYEQTFPIYSTEGVVWVYSRVGYKEHLPDGTLKAFGVLQRVEMPKEEAAKQALQRVNDLLYRQTSISHSLFRFLKDEDISAGIYDILKDILDFFRGGRVYIFQYDEKCRYQSCTYEVVAPGVEIDNAKVCGKGQPLTVETALTENALKNGTSKLTNITLTSELSSKEGIYTHADFIAVTSNKVDANLSYSSFEDIRKECSWMNGSWVK